MNMFARFDENPAMTLQDTKETKRYGRTDGRTDARTHTHGRENSIPTTNKVCGGYKNVILTKTTLTETYRYLLWFCLPFCFQKPILAKTFFSQNKHTFLNFVTLNMGVALHFTLQLATISHSCLILVLCASPITVLSDFIIADWIFWRKRKNCHFRKSCVSFAFKYIKWNVVHVSACTSVILFVFSRLCISSCRLAHTDTWTKHTDR